MTIAEDLSCDNLCPVAPDGRSRGRPSGPPRVPSGAGDPMGLFVV